MKFTRKATVGVALFGAASMSAYATSVTPPTVGPTPDPNSGAGGMVVEAWDATTGTSLTEWLGPTITSFGTPASTPAGGTTLDYGVLGSFSTTFTAAEIAAGNVQFTVSASNNLVAATPVVDATISTLGTIRNSAVLGIASNQVTAIDGILNAAAGCANANPCVALSTTAAGYAVTNLGANLGGLNGTSAAGVAGGAGVAFYQITATGGSSVAAASLAQFGNATGTATWTLASNGDLVYNVPGSAAVPLPAAIWLLGSGLLGLAGVGRRKAVAAA
jgi:hypothetical protein